MHVSRRKLVSGCAREGVPSAGLVGPGAPASVGTSEWQSPRHLIAQNQDQRAFAGMRPYAQYAGVGTGHVPRTHAKSETGPMVRAIASAPTRATRLWGRQRGCPRLIEGSEHG